MIIYKNSRYWYGVLAIFAWISIIGTVPSCISCHLEMTSVKTAKFGFALTDCAKTLLFGSAVSGYVESQLFWHRKSH